MLNRLDVLIQTNVTLLDQALSLVARIDDRAYSESPAGFAPHRVGAHLRHVLDFYACLFDGVMSGRIDYGARRRDRAVESSRRAGFARIFRVIRRLEKNSLSEAVLRVRLEDAPEGVDNAFMPSSTARELQALSSHTIHHFAMIALTLAAHGVDVAPDFGVAPSTLRHAARQAEAA